MKNHRAFMQIPQNRGTFNLNKHIIDDRLGSMENRQPFSHTKKLLSSTVLLPLLIALALSGCNALSRGDLMRQTDDTMMFSSIGFLISDNPDLYRNAVADISGSPSDIYINIPYYMNDGNTLHLSSWISDAYCIVLYF